jgi:hypothetical protein
MDARDEHILSLDDRLSALSDTRANCLYFVLTLTADKTGQVIFSTQTEWVGWSDEERREELRRARLVYPQFVELWRHVNQPYAVVHTTDELCLFLLGGGNALIEESLARRIFSRIFGDAERCVRDGETGFVSPDLLPEAAFRRAPTPKVRMQVLTRDQRRCRVCGRRPDDCVDIVLHVHHIRPWEKGGITDPRNLITLCHTCHAGLEPHDDPSLFQYLKPGDAADRQLAEFRMGVANYRRVGFLSGLRDKPQPRQVSRPPRPKGRTA